MNDEEQSDEVALDPNEAKAQQKAHLSFINSVHVPNRPKHDLRPLLAVFIAIIFIAIVALGLHFVAFSPKNSKAASKAPSSQSKAASLNPDSQPVSQSTQSYTSSTYNLSFNYPVGWSVITTTSGLLTVTSPPISIVGADKQKVIGEIIMTIQPEGQLPAGFSAGPALAVLNSQLISYANPTVTQSAQTYISYVQYSSTNTKGGLDGIYLSGNYGYTLAQTIPSGDISTIDPLVTVTFNKCSNAICSSNLSALTIDSASWIKNAEQPLVLKMLESFSFQ